MTPADLTAARAALARVRERHAAATPGPWRRNDGSGTVAAADGTLVASGTWPGTGDFIAHARADVPALAAVAEAAAGLVEDAAPEWWMGDYCENCDAEADEWYLAQHDAKCPRLRDRWVVAYAALAALGGGQ